MLEADTIIVRCGLVNFERTSWSKQHTHKFGRSHDKLATVADYDKLAGSFENNYPEVCDARSLWMIDCTKLDGTDRDKNLEIHVGRNSRITKSILGSKDCHGLHSSVQKAESSLQKPFQDTMIAFVPMFTTGCSDRYGDRALEATTRGNPRPES